MNVCLYSPYIPKHTGGGEKYMFDVASDLVKMGHTVSVGMSGSRELRNEEINQYKKKYEEFLNYSLEKVQFISTPLGTTASFWQKLWWTKKFDVLCYATDGSLFFSLAKKNILHIQVPFSDAKSSVVERIKLAQWSIKNTNSEFTKKIIEKNWKVEIPYVHYPMVNGPAKPVVAAEKEKVILNVGRFFKHLHAKRQDILVEIFQSLLKQYPEEMKGWKLVLIGSVEDETYAAEVAKQAVGFPIEISHHVSRTELLKWYQRSTVYWHAAGYDIDEEKEPEKVEHFGISTVEAMAYGCVPIVIGKGGQKEILGEELKNLLWQTKEEAVNTTIDVIKHTSDREKLSALAVVRSQDFGERRFEETLQKMLEK